MKKLPNKWLVCVTGSNNPLLPKFKEWFNKMNGSELSFAFKYYGMNEGKTFCTDYTCYQLITLEEWHDCVFGEQFEKGEDVLVRDSDWKDTTSWVTATFISEFDGKFVVDWDENVYYFDQCKKKPSELDIKIEELKKFAEENIEETLYSCDRNKKRLELLTKWIEQLN